MTRRRRGVDDLDSLDLLLDTICNMFGIFIFSALIVALLAMTRSKEIVQAAEEPTRTTGQTAKIASLETDVDQLSEQLTTLESGRSALIEERSRQSDEKIEKANQQLTVRIRTLEEYRVKLKRDADFVANLHEILPIVKREVEELTEAIRITKEIKDVEVRTPRRREMEGRTPVQLVIDKGKVFILNPWWEYKFDDHPCDIWSDWNRDAVDAAASRCDIIRCERGGAIEIRREVLLRKDGGIQAEDPVALAANKNWQEFLRAMDSRKHVVVIRCTATGFKAFGPVRSAIVSKRLPYNVDAIRLDPFYRDAILEGTPIGQ